MKQEKIYKSRDYARAVQVTSTAVLAIAMRDTLMPEWVTVREYAEFVGVSKTSARASLNLAVKLGLMTIQKTGLKSFFYEPAHPHLKALIYASRNNKELLIKIGKLTEIPF